jgi:hypothetical protein
MKFLKVVGRYLLRIVGAFWILDGSYSLVAGGKSIYGGPVTSTGGSLLNLIFGLLIWAWPIAALVKTFTKK